MLIIDQAHSFCSWKIQGHVICSLLSEEYFYAGYLVGKKEETSWSLLFAMNDIMILTLCSFFGTRKDRALSTPIPFTFGRFTMLIIVQAHSLYFTKAQGLIIDQPNSLYFLEIHDVDYCSGTFLLLLEDPRVGH